MNKTTNRLVILFIFILCACVFPISLIRKSVDVDFTMNYDHYVKTDLNIQYFKQTFVAQTSYLNMIAFDVGISGEISGEENLVICIMDEQSQKILAEISVPIQDVNDEAYTYVPVKKWIRKGKLYSVSVTAEGSERFSVVYSTETAEAALADQILYLEGEPVYGKAVLRFAYGFPLNIKNVLCLWAFIVTVGLSVLEIFNHKELGCDNAIIRRIDGLLDRYQVPILLLEFGVILFLVIRICRNEAVDWDEAYTWVLTTRNNIPDMLKTTAADVHPPLYYLIVMAAMRIFGKNIFVAKMVSVAGMAATCLLGLTIIRKRFGFKAAALFLPVAGLGTQIIYYNVNVRMYSWMIFFVMAAGLSSYEIIRNCKGKWWIAFTFFSLGGGIYPVFRCSAVVFLVFVLIDLVCDPGSKSDKKMGWVLPGDNSRLFSMVDRSSRYA